MIRRECAEKHFFDNNPMIVAVQKKMHWVQLGSNEKLNDLQKS